MKNMKCVLIDENKTIFSMKTKMYILNNSLNINKRT